MYFSTILTASLLVLPALCNPLISWGQGKVRLPGSPALKERTTGACNRDNLFRIMIDARYSASASAYCSVYIASTKTVVATTTPTVVVTSLTAKTLATLAVTETTFTVLTVTSFTTVAYNTIYEKRAVVTPPAPGQAGTYPPSRISSACSCIVTQSTYITTSTVTASPVTQTDIGTIPLTETTTITQTATKTETFPVEVTGTTVLDFCSREIMTGS